MRSGELRDSLARLGSSARWMAAILGGALVVRVGVAFLSGIGWYTPDSHSYFEMADRILAGDPRSLFPNGYPLLIAAVKLAAPGPRVPAIMMGINVLLSTAVVGATYALARRLQPHSGAAVGAAAVVALYPNQLVYLHYLLSEVSAEFLLCGAVLALCAGRWALGGAGLALASLFRSTLSPVLPLTLLLVWMRCDRRRALLPLASGAAVVLLAYGGLLAADVVQPTSNLSINLRLAVADTSSGFRFSRARLTPLPPGPPLLTYARFAWDHPATFLLQRASSLWELWGPYPLDTPRAVWANLLIGLRFPLLMIALAWGWRHRHQLEIQLMLLPVGVITIVHTAFFSAARFSYVVMPIVIAIATAALLEPRGAPERTDAFGGS